MKVVIKINKNLVLIFRKFQYRVELFFKTTIIDNGFLGKINYYAVCVEFHVRGSPQVHSFIWILNLPKITKFNIEEYKRLVNMGFCINLQNPPN